MENNHPQVEILFEKVQDYTKSSVELYKLQAVNICSDVASSLATQFVLFAVVAMFTLAANIGIALWLGNILGKTYYGFFIVAAFYIIAAIIIYIFRKRWIKTPVRNAIITQMLK